MRSILRPLTTVAVLLMLLAASTPTATAQSPGPYVALDASSACGPSYCKIYASSIHGSTNWESGVGYMQVAGVTLSCVFTSGNDCAIDTAFVVPPGTCFLVQARTITASGAASAAAWVCA